LERFDFERRVRRFATKPAANVGGVIEEHGGAGPLDAGENSEADFGLQEVDREAPAQIGEHERFEDVAIAVRTLEQMEKDEEKGEREERFVKLRGMAADAVAEIDAPGERGGDAIGAVRQAGEEAANAPDGDAERDGRGEEVAGGARLAGEALGQFDEEQAANQRADDGLAAEQVDGIAPAGERGGRVLEPVEDAAADRRARDAGGDNRPAGSV